MWGFKMYKFNIVVFILFLFLSSCGFSSFSSEEIEGTWECSDTTDGRNIAETIVLSNLIEAEVSITVVDEDQEETQETIEQKSGDYVWDVFISGQKSLELSSEGTFVIGNDAMDLILTPQDETKEVKVYIFMLVNDERSMDLVIMEGNVGVGRRYSKQ